MNCERCGTRDLTGWFMCQKGWTILCAPCFERAGIPVQEIPLAPRARAMHPLDRWAR